MPTREIILYCFDGEIIWLYPFDFASIATSRLVFSIALIPAGVARPCASINAFHSKAKTEGVQRDLHNMTRVGDALYHKLILHVMTSNVVSGQKE